MFNFVAIKKILITFIALVVQSLAFAATCTISGSVTASATTCNTLSTGDTMLITGTLTINANYNVQASNDIVFIIDGGSITWSSNADLNAGHNSTFVFINGGALISGAGSCNASKRILFSGTSIVSCNGGGTALYSFAQYNTAGGGSVAGPLPVELIKFEVKNQGGYNKLFWVTASEYNNSHFEIQNSSDGVNFITIAKINGAGNSNQLIYYSYVDSSKSISYYRLKQIDFNGSFEYSKVIKISGQKNISINEVSVFPNPSNGKIKIEIIIPDIQNIQVTLYDKQGKTILSQSSIEYFDDISIISLDLSYLPTDIYFVQTIVDQKAIVTKLVKL